MKEIIMDTLIDGLKLIPFLFIAFLIIELIEHKLSNRNKDLITKTGKFGPMFGSILGMFPQCGFSVLATNLYVTRIVSLGTLISIYLSTSDEMLPILLSENVEIGLIIKILLIKLFIGMVSGFIIDFILRKKESKVEADYEICHEENCHCKEHLLLSVIKHTIHITLFLMIISFLLNCLLEYTGILDTNNIIANNPFSVFVTSLIGLIPNCGASVMITTLYLKDIISFASMISGLLTGSGVALLVLFRSNKKLSENIIILSLVYFIGVGAGLILELKDYIW
jgi:putative flippase GtrA